MKNDKLVLILMIVNIIVLVSLGAFISSKQNEKKDKPKEDKPIVVNNDGIKKCHYTKSENNITETREILVNYTDNLVNGYSITYNIISSDKDNVYFINNKNQIEALLSRYQTDTNVKISDYKFENDEYNIKLYFNLKNIKNSTIIPIQYQQDINKAIEVIKNLDYICE